MCDSLVATGRHSASGATVFGKNSDRKMGESQPFLQFPAALHPRGAMLRCTHIAIPQVAETYRIMGHSPWWVWGFEHGVNEHGVAIGNQTVFSREPVAAEPGLIGMDLVRLGLERGRDAREALEVIATLIETYGQGGAAFGPEAAGYHNSFMIADPEVAWVLETSGRRWAARPVECTSLSNQFSLGADWAIGSRDLDSFARSEGWWRDGARVDVAAAYRNPDVPGVISEGRLRRSRELLAAREPHDADSFRCILRDHLDGGAAPPPGVPPSEERHFTLCAHSEQVHFTASSLVAALPSDRTVWPVWISFGTPCTGLFLPVYLQGVIPPMLAIGGPDYDRDSAWWVFQRLERAAAADLASRTPQLRRAWEPLEQRLEEERLRAEQAARAEAVAGDPTAAAAGLTRFMAQAWSEALDEAEALASRIAA